MMAMPGHHQWGVSIPMAMAYMIWQATYGNGVQIGMEQDIISIRRKRIRLDRVQGIGEFCVGVRGTATTALTCV